MKTRKMKMKWACAVVLLPAIASAQFDTGSGAAPGGFDFGGGAKTDKPWTEFKLNSKTRIKLNLQNATADAVIKFYENVSGVTIVKDPALTGTLAISSARPVPLNDAFAILAATLTLKGFTMSKQDNLLIIKSTAGGGGGRDRGQNGPMGGFPQGIGGGDNTPVTRFYTIKNANASQLARVLNDVYTPPAQNNQFNFQRGGPGGGGNQFGGGGGQFGAGGFGQASLPQVRASADDYSNSVIVNAPESVQGQVKALITSLDMPSDLPQHTKVYALKFASAQDTVSEVQTVLTANVPRGRGGATTGQQSGPAAFIGALRGQTPGSGQVVADNRTNSLIVTATDDDIKIVDSVIASVDHDVQVQSTTFVFPLSNARADSVALLIQQAFGNKQGVTAPNPTQLQNQSGSVSRANGSNSGLTKPTSSSLTGQDLSNDPNADLAMNFPSAAEQAKILGPGLTPKYNGTSNSALPNLEMQKQLLAQGQNYLPLQLADPNAQSGDLYTSIGVTSNMAAAAAAVQGFGGGGGRGFGGGGQTGGGAGTQTTYTTGHDPSGALIQTRDLTGQVTAIADINSNQIVVVASPENAEIIRKMIAALDQIPKQVMIQTVIVEASLDRNNKLGVEWNFTSALSKLLHDPSSVGTGGTNFGVQTGANSSAATTVPGFTYAITGKTFGAFLQALEADTKFQILATPRIITTNNVQGSINVSQSIPYVTSVQSDSAGNPTYSYNFLPVGIILTIQPRILNNGYVTLDIDQTANELAGFINVGNVNAPEVNQREATTTVTVKDSETIILGGIIQKTVSATTNKIPLLGDLPILGNLFRSTSKEVNRTELMIFMTPHVVNAPEDAKKLAGETLNELTPESRKDVESELSKKPVLPTIKP